MGCTFENYPNVLLNLDYYPRQKAGWPKEGKHILAHYNDKLVVVYQAYNRAIADYAASHGTFRGCPDFSLTRMTWIKTSFLWMMYRSNWGRKPNQEATLAIWLKREGFDTLLRMVKHSRKGEGPSGVRIQWDPDHTPKGGDARRRAIQLGMRGKVVERYMDEWIAKIEDISGFVTESRVLPPEELKIPEERLYITDDRAIMKIVEADTEC